MSRMCARPGCDRGAVSSMTYDYGQRSVWITELSPEPHPALYDLCDPCAAKTAPPRGWVLTDDRERPLFEAAG